VVVYTGFWFAAPEFANFAGVPEATPVVRLYTATILVDGMITVRNAYLLRTFQQNKVIQANMAGIVANALVAIGLSAAGVGAISLAAGQVASEITMGVLTVIWARLPFKVGLDLGIAKRLMRYGVPLAAGLGVESVIAQSDKVIVGRLMGATVLGFYLLAFNISSWVPGMIGSAIRYVTVPGFSRLSEADADALSKGVQRAATLLVMFVVPIAVLVGVLAEPTISFLYGVQWLPAAPALRFLMILMFVRMLTAMGMDILMGAGATRWTLLINIGWAAAVVPAVWIGTKVDGIRGAAIAGAIVGVLVAMPLAVVALHRAGVQVAPIAPGLVRPLLGGAVACTVALLLDMVAGSNSFVQLAVAGTGGLLAYLAVGVPRPELRRMMTSAAQPLRRHAKPPVVAPGSAGPPGT
jgi:O-antigen/teichoic acid export membrane protein